MSWNKYNWIGLKTLIPAGAEPFKPIPEEKKDCPPTGWTKEEFNERVNSELREIEERYKLKEEEINRKLKSAQDNLTAEINAAKARATQEIKQTREGSAREIKMAQETAAREIEQYKAIAANEIKIAQDEANKKVAEWESKYNSAQEVAAQAIKDKLETERKAALVDDAAWQAKLNKFKNLARSVADLYLPLFQNIETVIIRTHQNQRYASDFGISNVAALKFDGHLLYPKPERVGFLSSGKYAAYAYNPKLRGKEPTPDIYLRHAFYIDRSKTKFYNDVGWATDVERLFLGEGAKKLKEWNVFVDPTRNLLYPRGGELNDIPVLFRNKLVRSNVRDNQILHWDTLEHKFVWLTEETNNNKFIAIPTKTEWEKLLSGELLGVTV